MSLKLLPPLPGVVIRHEVLNLLGITQAELAQLTGLSKVRISHVVTGKAPITIRVAIRLERVTGKDAGYWMGPQTAFDLHYQRTALASETSALPTLEDIRAGQI